MKIYISGKISGLNAEEYRKNFEKAANKVVSLYYVPVRIINPVRLRPALGLELWVCYMISCLRAQRKCTHSAFQANWIDSRGAVIEYFFARFIYRQKILFLA